MTTCARNVSTAFCGKLSGRTADSGTTAAISGNDASELKACIEIENIVTTADELFRHAR